MKLPVPVPQVTTLKWAAVIGLMWVGFSFACYRATILLWDFMSGWMQLKPEELRFGTEAALKDA